MKRPAAQPGPSITAPQGFRAVGITCGIKESGKPDLALIVADGPCAAAGVFTQNQFPGAPVIVSKQHIADGNARAIVCNSGISNVATGQAGIDNAKSMCSSVAQQIGCPPEEVLVGSTGVIGQPLPIDKITTGIETAYPQLARGNEADAAAAEAILTTDLVTKSAARQVQLGDQTITLGGIAKGSGMIAPNMATMLVFLTTDAGFPADQLQDSLRVAVNQSFNRMSIDSDTSTSDSVLLLASAAVDHPRNEQTLAAFTEALQDICKDLTYQLIRDGEGVTKVFHVHVRGATNEADADAVGRAVVDSPLVKTAVHGGDPNWGRLVMAVGKSNARIVPKSLSISIGDHPVITNGEPDPGASRKAEQLAAAMEGADVYLTIDLGIGEARAAWLGGDLSREYIHINADYTT